MNAELKRGAAVADWATWENQVVGGRFPLRRLLGSSKHNAVFLTARGATDVAVKFVPADRDQLARWEKAGTLSHPHLVQIFEVGQHRSAGREFSFLVMELADQTLSGILRRRSLDVDELRELLVPTLDALTFLHRRHLVHGRLKPSNFLAVGDALKLSSDSVCSVGLRSPTVDLTPYDAPELPTTGHSMAADVWNLGASLFEALTQRAPISSSQPFAVDLPSHVPADLADTVRRCLSMAPADRPSVIELRSEYKVASPAASAPTPQPLNVPQVATPPHHHRPPERDASQAAASADAQRPERGISQETMLPGSEPAAGKIPREATLPNSEPVAGKIVADGLSEQRLPKRGLSRWVVAGALLASLAVWWGFRGMNTSEGNLQSAIVPATEPAQADYAKTEAPEVKQSRPSPRPVERPSPPAAEASEIIHEVRPEVPRKILNTIQGRVHVTVRVLVGPSGEVAGALLENPGPSKYFARVADEAARQWVFAPADTERPRVWLLTFVFTRDDVVVRTTEQ